VKISVKEIRKHKPCYDPCEIEGIEADTEMSLLEWMRYRADKVSDKDKIWLFDRFATSEVRKEFCIWCMKRCKTENKEIKEYQKAVEKYLDGKITKKELDKVNRTANRAAYRTADWAAYRTADRAAYSVANRSAYWAADRSAYWAAYWASYSAAKRKKQVAKIIELLQQEVKK